LNRRPDVSEPWLERLPLFAYSVFKVTFQQPDPLARLLEKIFVARFAGEPDREIFVNDCLSMICGRFRISARRSEFSLTRYWR